VVKGKYNRRLSDQRGATMVEFAVAASLFFMILRFTFDIGIAIYHYSLLTQATVVSVREVALAFSKASKDDFGGLGVGRKCSEYEEFIQTDADYGFDITLFAKADLGIHGDFKLEPDIRPGSTQSSFIVTIEGKWKQNWFLAPDFTLKARADALIENRSFSCGKGLEEESQ